MEIGKPEHRNRFDHPRGVALLISLSVILLLSIALMKNFEKRSLEVAHLGNNLQRFQAESLSISGLNLILSVIKEKGLSTVEAYKNQMKEIPIPVGNGSFQLNELTSIDHRFNLNSKITNEKDTRVSVFKNMVSISNKLTGGYDDSSGANANEALSAIIDWTDPDDRMDEVFLYDSEQYYREEPSFSVKNSVFDRLSEVKLLPAFRFLGFSMDYLENNFRVLGKTTEYVDVNLVTEKSLRNFLNRYENVTDFSIFFDQQDKIWEIIAEQRLSQNPDMSSGTSPIKPAFPAKDFEKNWNDKLVAANINLSLEAKALALFQPYSETLLIRYRVQVGQATINIRSIVQIDYVNPLETLDIKELKILSFRMI